MTDKKKLVQYVTRHSVIFSTFQNLTYIPVITANLKSVNPKEINTCIMNVIFLFVNTNNKKNL